MDLLFWLPVGLLLFTYFGYPLILAAWEGASQALAGARWVVGGAERRRGALKALVLCFDDEMVGAAVGRLRLFNRERRDYEESAYWKYETLLKHWEGRRGAVLGANGGLYAVRKELFQSLRPDSIVDDF